MPLQFVVKYRFSSPEIVTAITRELAQSQGFPIHSSKTEFYKKLINATTPFIPDWSLRKGYLQVSDCC